MTKAEKAAKAWVDKLWVDLVDPGEDAGPNMDANKFNIEDFVDSMLSMSYARNVPEAARIMALRLARKLWNERLDKKNEPKYTESALPGNASLADLYHIGQVNW